MIKYSMLVGLLLTFSMSTPGCRDKPQPSNAGISRQEVADADQMVTAFKKAQAAEATKSPEPKTIDPKDRAFLNFGEYFAVKEHLASEFTNPHEVVAHAVWKCSQAQTKELLLQMPHVETDMGLGKAFVSFLESFGPDLEQFRHDKLQLKFQAYRLNEDTSVWYYFLCNADGDKLKHAPWVSSHRSRSTGRCALTGIFLFDPDIGDPGPMPGGLVTTLESK